MRLRRTTAAGFAALAIAGLVTISCGGITDPSKNATETFTGTVVRGGSSTPVAFNVSDTGEFSIKVTGFSPSFSGQFGVYYGQGDASNCAVIQANPVSQVNFTALSGQIFKGGYCAVVYDTTGFPSTVTYTMTISHP